VGLFLPGKGLSHRIVRRLEALSQELEGATLTFSALREETRLGQTYERGLTPAWLKQLVGHHLVERNRYRSMKAVIESICLGLEQNDLHGIALEIRTEARRCSAEGWRAAKLALSKQDFELVLDTLLHLEGAMCYAHVEKKQQALTDLLVDEDSCTHLWMKNFWDDLCDWPKKISWAWTARHNQHYFEHVYWDKCPVLSQAVRTRCVESTDESESDESESEGTSSSSGDTDWMDV
jgi:hypothetical protein